MGNVLSEAKRQQVIALGRLGWSLRRIEQETGVRRETAGGYLKAAGIAVGRPGGWKKQPGTKPAMPVTTDSGPEIFFLNLPTECFSKPAMEVTTDLGRSAVSVEESRPTSASVYELYRETIQLGLSRGRNAMGIWQDHCTSNNCWRGLTRPEPASALSAMSSTNDRPNLECVAFWAYSLSSRSTAARPPTRPAPWPWSWACLSTASYDAAWNAARKLL